MGFGSVWDRLGLDSVGHCIHDKLDSVGFGLGWISLDSVSDWVWARFGIGWVWARLGFVFMTSWTRLGLDSVEFGWIRVRIGFGLALGSVGRRLDWASARDKLDSFGFGFGWILLDSGSGGFGLGWIWLA